MKDVDSAAARDDKWMLEGRMRVGDSVDDEWCVVWILREISKKWDFAIRSDFYLGAIYLRADSAH